MLLSSHTSTKVVALRRILTAFINHSRMVSLTRVNSLLEDIGGCGANTTSADFVTVQLLITFPGTVTYLIVSLYGR